MEILDKRLRRLQWAVLFCCLAAVAGILLAARADYKISAPKAIALERPGFSIHADAGGKHGNVLYLYTYEGPNVLVQTSGYDATISIGGPGAVRGISLRMEKNGVSSITVPDLKGDSALVITNEYGKAAIVHKPYWQVK